jgi:sugar lactone lactonase YvrE
MRIRPARSADVVVDCACLLGEGPTWDAADARLLWLDVDAPALHQLDRTGRHLVIALEGRVTALVPTVAGGWVGAVDGGVAEVDPSGRIGRTIATLPSDGDGVTNDGRCDRQGRFWVGTTDRSGARRGGLFCVAADGSWKRLLDRVGLSNGLDWSPDGTVCHYVDSSAHSVANLHLDGDGLPVSSRTLVQFDATPDGLTVDCDGGIWVALWDRGAVDRYTPDGRLDAVVPVPGGFVTSCAFGGPDLATLFITSARTGLSTDELAASPHAGALFAADVGWTGCGYTPFGDVGTSTTD